jgi:ribosomal protein L7/L12
MTRRVRGSGEDTMAKHATSRAELLEREYEVAMMIVVRATIGLVLSLIGVFIFARVPQVQLQLFFIILAAASAIAAVYGAVRVVQARNKPFVAVECPYCRYPMKFPEQPTEDFDCEKCHRRVYFEDDGTMADVIDVTCAVCKTAHRVSVKANRYLCDGCGRALNLPGQAASSAAAPGAEAAEAYSVSLTEVGRRPAEVALAVQDMLVTNMVEARRRMQHLPLLVADNVPMRKADAIGRRLEDLGASVAIRPVAPTHSGRP